MQSLKVIISRLIFKHMNMTLLGGASRGRRRDITPNFYIQISTFKIYKRNKIRWNIFRALQNSKEEKILNIFSTRKRNLRSPKWFISSSSRKYYLDSMIFCKHFQTLWFFKHCASGMNNRICWEAQKNIWKSFIIESRSFTHWNVFGLISK